MDWRTALTTACSSSERRPTTPTSAIAEDLRLFVDETLNLSLGLLNAVVTLVSFVGILWVLSGPLERSVYGREHVRHSRATWYGWCW